MPKQITLSGGFDQISLLRYGSTEEIRSTVKRNDGSSKETRQFYNGGNRLLQRKTRRKKKVFEFVRAAKDFGEY